MAELQMDTIGNRLDEACKTLRECLGVGVDIIGEKTSRDNADVEEMSGMLASVEMRSREIVQLSARLLNIMEGIKAWL